MFHVPEKYRIRTGPMGSDETYGNNGAFEIKHKGHKFFVIASDGAGWEHVSITLPNRTPSWKEMCYFKDMFWDHSDVVVQYHPAKDTYIDNHPFCLHLWRPIIAKLPAPNSLLVGL